MLTNQKQILQETLKKKKKKKVKYENKNEKF